MLSCNNLDNVKKTYDDAVNAYNALLTDWRAVVNGAVEISPQKSQLARAKAAYEQAVINCNLAKNSVNDTGIKSAYASLVQGTANLESLSNLSERTLLTAKVQLEQAKLDLEEAQQQIEDAKIIAPFDGIVGDVLIRQGQYVNAGMPIAVIADPTGLHIETTDLNEKDIAGVTLGSKADVTFDALPGVIAEGTVSEIAPKSTKSAGELFAEEVRTLTIVLEDGKIERVLSGTDAGIGIRSEDLPHVFDRFYRADPARTRVSGGAGLGLALVKWIVEAHKGTIHVHSEPEKGTAFEIFLPSK